ncbi:ABC transporter ATP-binding protein [Alicyclobacillus mengziensis]|uniref:ABC transporter ATP-binding protein n=1 Tax=Alicyclobacillus mengziensis TaxID=2931921 RepID=A0A9X7VZC1_9BACL|nr:ABC transporter ATP-binding protein [Alicyclobacillus mengziensis]QSO47247.1 ABC transporter ATP-binding protein [Alicyclobacillus mengziensis]
MLQVKDLSVTYRARRGPGVAAVRGVDFEIPDSTFVGLVGESGCGKSTLGFAIAALLDERRNTVRGHVLLDGVDLYQLSPDQLRALRWSKLSVVLQGGMNAFNPVLRLKHQFMDVMKAHAKLSKAEMTKRIAQLLAAVELDPAVMESYPHELSGGMKQRAAIALALVLEPRLVILDEPTTALDVVVQRSIVTMLSQLQHRLRFSVLFVSHDLGLVLEVAQRVMVMYAGQIVEDKPADLIIDEAHHPYTKALLGCYANPRATRVSLTGIPGTPPDLREHLHGCPFAPRCTQRMDICETEAPRLLPLKDGSVACHLYTHKEVPAR